MVTCFFWWHSCGCFSTIAWRRGGYDITQLRNKLENNHARAQWVMTQTERYVADMNRVRGLGFCVSVEHANFMEKYCREHNIPAVAILIFFEICSICASLF